MNRVTEEWGLLFATATPPVNGKYRIEALPMKCAHVGWGVIRFYNAATNLLGIRAQVHAVVNIHTDWFSHDLASRSLRHSSITLRQLLTLLSALHLRQFQPTGSLPVVELPGRPGDAVF